MSDDEQSKPTKRRKTARACDYCRDHKLKCDFSTEKAGTSSLKCKHCKDFGIDCNISARIFPQRASASSISSTTKDIRSLDAHMYRRMEIVAQTEPRYAGPTSLSQLVSAVTRKWPTRANQMMSQMDLRYGHARVEGVSGGPFLMLPQVRYPPEQLKSPDLEGAKIDSATKRFRECGIAICVTFSHTHPIASPVLSKYQRFLARIFPILSDKESTDAVELGQENQTIASLSNVGLALLSIAAMIRDTPTKTRMALLYHLRRRRHVDVSSSIETVQYLLLLCANVEILSPDTNVSTGMSINLTGLLVRMAQDLGLHRDISPLKVSKENLNRRARIWAACVIADRWYSISYGQPCLIRPEDCDAPPPSPYLDSDDGVSQSPVSRLYEVHVEHAKLSILIGRLLRLVFTPSGMRNTSVEDMEMLKLDLDAWDYNLPSSLRMFGRQELRNNNIGAGLLHILKVAVDFIFYRAALVSSYNTSKSASMAPLPFWESIVKRSAEAIDWISTAEGTSVLDAWSIVMYAMIQCCLVQFYAAINGEDPEPLRQARKCLHSWGSSIEAQSHGFYEPIEGGEVIPSSTTTSAEPADPNAMGRKSLTLRTKAYTVVAMLAGIAEHHIADRLQLNQEPTNSDTLKVIPQSNHAGKGKYRKESFASSSSRSPYGFNAVMNPGGPIPSMSNHGHHHGQIVATAATMSHYNSSNTMQPPIFPDNTQYLSSSNGMSSNTSSAEIEQVDLLTLQNWATEIMQSTPGLGGIPFSQPINHQQKHPYL